MPLILLLFFLFGCSKAPSHFQGVAHTHSYHIQVGNPLTNYGRKDIENIISKTFEEVDALYNHWNPYSLLSTNPDAPKLKAILTLAHSFQVLTDGRYNPTLGAPIKTFKTKGVLPKESSAPSYDLDGMLKGYVVDLLIEKLTQQRFCQNLYVEWGGEIRVIGKHPSGRKWHVLVDKEIVTLEDQAIATSGAQEQLWDIDGSTYTHIMNPLTSKMLKVEEGRVSFVTVKAPTCSLADALATACMTCETIEEASKFAKQMKEKYPVEFWIGIWHIKP